VTTIAVFAAASPLPARLRGVLFGERDVAWQVDSEQLVGRAPQRRAQRLQGRHLHLNRLLFDQHVNRLEGQFEPGALDEEFAQLGRVPDVAGGHDLPQPPLDLHPLPSRVRRFAALVAANRRSVSPMATEAGRRMSGVFSRHTPVSRQNLIYPGCARCTQVLP
jgi:hypothetical protein